MFGLKRSIVPARSGLQYTKSVWNPIVYRYYSKPSGGDKPISASVHPDSPARTRFAPSPTGFLHLGSLRTALYNYLLAKNTGGTFILRLEDTDRKRLVEGAEENIYESLKWCGINIDEGPQSTAEAASFGPYRQSDRREIYRQHIQTLLESGHAYKCYCSKERMDSLRQSAMKLKPPTTVTYDRKCLHETHEGSAVNPGSGSQSDDYVVRFKSPVTYPPFEDLTHGTLNLQPQYNEKDRRFDDFVIMKSDGLPTYHFANVVDDHLMGITHVIRGEEWLSSTPKHVALYNAFGWTPPKFIHIPLLTSLKDKKLSKRSGDIGVLSLRDNSSILPEALVNFVALFGWSPPRLQPGVSTTEVMTMPELISSFSLDNLTKGNAKVSDEKLKYFNKLHLQKRLESPEQLEQLVDQELPKYSDLGITREYLKLCLVETGPSLTTVNDLKELHSYLFTTSIDYSLVNTTKLSKNAKQILEKFLKEFEGTASNDKVQAIIKSLDYPKKEVFMTLRYALSGGKSGLTMPVLIEVLGSERTLVRLEEAINSLN